jgi:hydroxymethylglutaryl-CoA lyase
VRLREVGPRDGLQGERPVDPGLRVELVTRLLEAGVTDIEVAAFVSPKAVPSMAGAADVVAGVRDVVAALDPPAAPTVWALVPNRRGAELATSAGVEHLTITMSASPAYSVKNTGRTVDEALAGLAEIRAVAPAAVLDAVVSCCFGSPFPGESIAPGDVQAIVAMVGEADVDRVTLADTTGVATPRRIAAVVGVTGPAVGLHLHDTRGTALLNAWTAIELGVEHFDTALGGLGGSPFAPGAGGNLATEDLVILLDDVGVATGVDLDRLLAAGPVLRDLVGHDLASRVAAAGPLEPASGAGPVEPASGAGR